MDEHTKGRMSKRAHVKRHGVDKYKKFIGNQSEGQGFADNRKRKIQHEYLKILSKQRKKEEYETGQQLKGNDKYTEEDSLRGKKFTKYSKSEWHSQQRKEEKARKKTEALRRKREREEALAKYNSKKTKEE